MTIMDGDRVHTVQLTDLLTFHHIAVTPVIRIDHVHTLETTRSNVTVFFHNLF